MGETVTMKEIAQATGKNRSSILRRSAKEKWPFTEMAAPGGRVKIFRVKDLPSDIQVAVIQGMDEVPVDVTCGLCPEAALAAAEKSGELMPVLSGPANGRNGRTWEAGRAVGMDVVRDERVKRVARIVQEALDVPKGWKKRAWVESVAERYGVGWQTIYKWIKKYHRSGLAGLQHTKSTRGTATAWDEEALEWWVGLNLKREHRKISKEELYYSALMPEAAQRGWNIGSYRSALWWLDKRLTPQLLALQRGGRRALDNVLPPILRDYSDLQPFDIVVGDQHRWDFWCVDEDTGEVLRPEGYFWQDLRTRVMFGGAVDRKYDSHLIGLALRIGIRVFGAPRTIYTDNGKPELSRYMMGIMKDLRGLGMEVKAEEESYFPADGPAEEVNPLLRIGTHRKAIVKNAKAKMIEGTFSSLEAILRNQLKVPGYVKDLGGDPDENDVDMAEIQRLALSGKLLTTREFALAMYRAMDIYNHRHHRGVLKEWAWKPKPKGASPLDCLQACYAEGWRPRPVSPEAADLVFLCRATRVVDRGRITLDGRQYEHDALITLHKSSVKLRYDPMDMESVIVLSGNEYICTAEPVEYSSMIDADLTTRKNMEKAKRRKAFAEEYRKLTAAVPDIREYSKIPPIEKAAALVGRDKKKRAAEQAEMTRIKTPEELQREVARLEAMQDKPVPRKPLPERPGFFMTDLDRYAWCLKFEAAGGALSEDDQAFMAGYETGMSDEDREHWQARRQFGG
jgi:putative transposase